MRCELIKNHEADIKLYCEKNDLSYNTLITSILSWDEKEVSVFDSTPDPEREKLGLADKVPMTAVLEIFLENGKLRFEQTEHTRKYLGVADKTGRRVA
jgi:hypothetical protein